MKLRHYITSSIRLLLLFVGAGLAHGQATVVSDTFSTAGSLNGHVPDTAVGGAAWVGLTGTGAATTGNGVLTLPGTSQTGSLDLGANYLATHPGVYCMSASMTMHSKGTGAGSAFGFGFVANPVTTLNLSYPTSSPGQNPAGGSNSGMPWVYVTPSGMVYFNDHDYHYVYASSAAVYADNMPHVYKFTLDTTQPHWVMTACIDGSPVNLSGSSPGFTYATNPVGLRYVAICAGVNSAPVSLTNFSLTVTTTPILINDTFSTAGPLNGHMPDTTVGGAAWVALTGSGAATTINSVLTVPSTNQTDSLDLGANYFATHPGVYCLSTTINLPNGATYGNQIGFGFVANPVTNGTLSMTTSSAGQNPNGGLNSGVPWVYLTPAGTVYVNDHDSHQIYLSPPNNGSPPYPTGVPHSFMLTLDTTQPHWVMTACIDGLPVNLSGTSPSFTYPTNPVGLRYVAICAGSGPVPAYFYNFKLTCAPSPTVVSDTFSTAGSLNGHVPDTAVGGAAWVGLTGTGAATTGNGVLTLPGTSQTGSLDLGANYLATHPGVYCMSASMTMHSKGTGAGSAFGFGFVANPVTTLNLSYPTSSPGQNPAGGSNSGMPWVYVTPSGMVYFNDHDYHYVYASSAAVYADNMPHVYKFTLDTTQPHWVMTACIDGSPVNLSGSSPGFTYATNPVGLRYVAICAGVNSAPVSLTNFSLTVMNPVPALRADSLVDSIGVNIFADRAEAVLNPTLNLTELTGAGIRHARDFLAVDGGGYWRANSSYHTVSTGKSGDGASGRWQALGQNGITLCFSICPEYGGGGLDKFADGINGMKNFLVDNNLYPYTDYVENVNEPDIFYDDQTDNPTYYIGPTWPSHTDTVAADMWSTFKGDPLTAAIPILAPPLANSANDASVGDLTQYVDYGNIHPYPNGALPTANLTGYMINEQFNAGSKPVIATETGYQNAVNTAPGGSVPSSELAASLYVPRLYLEYLALGVRRTYWFNLLDDPVVTYLVDSNKNPILNPDGTQKFTTSEDNGNTIVDDHWGLLNFDGSYVKPAYTALQNLITTLSDANTSFIPTGFPYTLSETPSMNDVKSMLFQKQNGSYFLAIWRTVSVGGYYVDANHIGHVTCPDPGTTTITVTFPSPRTASVSYPTPNSGTATTPTSVSSVQIPLAGQVAIVQF